MIQVSDLVFEYTNRGEKKTVINGIDLLIHEGESVGLLGSNGSGKTTLARCLNGLLAPAAGHVLIDNLDTQDAAAFSIIRSRVGMVFQNPENQIVSTTVEREIAFGLENLGTEYDEMHQIVDDILQRFDLEKYRTHPPHLLSGGEMQRLALASVMAMSPKYIIFDEPTSLLDIASRKNLLAIIAEIHQRNLSRDESRQISTIFITQYPEETLLFDRLLVLNQGRIVLDGKPMEIFEKVDELRRLNLESPVEFDINHYLRKISNGKFSLNTSDFPPIP